MQDFKNMTDKEVQIEYSYVAHTVNDTDTFTQEDCFSYELLTSELRRRGYEVRWPRPRRCLSSEDDAEILHVG